MSSNKRLRAPLVVLSGIVMAVVAFAGPASASDAYPPPQSTTVLGTTATAPQVAVAGVSASSGNLAFTGSNAVGIGALGGLLLVGGGALVVAGRRRKANA